MSGVLNVFGNHMQSIYNTTKNFKLNGRKDKDRLNVTGTTHGGIEQIGGQWYVFYHRLTHGTDYSRQGCAEKIYM